MGKVVEEKKKKKKKGRPSLLDLQKRTLREQQEQQQQQQQQQLRRKKGNYNSALKPISNYKSATPLRRSSRRNPNPSRERSDEEGEEEEEEEEGEEELAGSRRREKELKLVLKVQKPLPNSNSNSNASDSDEKAHKKRKINAIGGGSGGGGDYEKGEKLLSDASPTNNNQGAQLESGPSTPLPDKKLLLFILERLQKKDTYGVFSEPADPEELPDYHEVIEHPMDFGTVRKKLADGAYANLEQFEKDVFLICSNAMQYNAPDTIYFRQARSIQELAKKNFENLRQDSDDNEPETKVVRRGRPPTKNFKKPLGRPSLEGARSEFSDVTLASGPENTALTNNDLRKVALHLDKSGFTDSSGCFYGSRNDVNIGWLAENKFERNDEVSMSKGYLTKNGKKQFVLDENRRNTYRQFQHSIREPSVLTTFGSERKQLMTVGLHSEHGYTRSLAHFAANLGSIAWKIAEKRIERCLPSGIKFGPGWVGENDITPQRLLLLSSSTVGLPSSSQPILIADGSSSAATHSIELKGDKLTERPKGEDSSEKPAPSTHSASDGHLTMPDSSSLYVANRSSEPCTAKAEAVEGLNSHTGFKVLNSNVGAIITRPPFPSHQNSVIDPGMNGLNGTYGFNLPAQMGNIIRAAGPAGFSFQSSQMLDRVCRTNTNFVQSVAANCLKSEDSKSADNLSTMNTRRSLPKLEGEASAASLPGNHQATWQGLSQHGKTDSWLSPQQKPDAVPPDLNVRFHSPGSPSSSSRVDLTQPDLALQL